MLSIGSEVLVKNVFNGLHHILKIMLKIHSLAGIWHGQSMRFTGR